jgi:putative CocE/NonD family hydrolase
VSLHLAFFDRYLKGLSTRFDSHFFDSRLPVSYFVMGVNQWRTSDAWPPEYAQPVDWYLHSGGKANTAAGDGVLSRELPTHEPVDDFVYDPAKPVATVGGATLLHSLYKSGPLDQSPIEQREDVLVYTSAPLAEPIEVTGIVSVVLHVASDAPDTDFVARLVDVYPDGRAITITDGILRLRHRDGWEPAPYVPGQPARIEIDLWSTSQVFLPGHQLRLDVSSSSFPRWERNLNTGLDASSAEMRIARQTIYHDAEHRSCLRVSTGRLIGMQVHNGL